VRAAFVDRAITVVERLTDTVDEPRLRAALEADTDAAILTALGLIENPSGEPAAPGPDPLATARLRGEQAKRDILAAQGNMLDPDTVAARLGWSSEVVEERRQAGLLLALPLDHDTWGFPTWQFTEEGLLSGLEQVLRSLNAPDPWSRILFLQSGDPYLDGQTPLELIRRGEIEPVRRLAASYDELVAT
jgi:hypothetical protein